MTPTSRTCLIAVCLLIAPWTHAADVPATTGSKYSFDGTISRAVLENFLSRSITVEGLFNGRGNFDDNLRMLKTLRAKYAGRSLCLWGAENHFLTDIERAKTLVPRAVRADPEMILEACVFETVGPRVGRIAVPDWVFTAFSLPVAKRNFIYEQIIYPAGQRRAIGNAQVPDVSRQEAQLWFLPGGLIYRPRFRGHPFRSGGDHEPQRPRQRSLGASTDAGPSVCGQARPPAHGPLQRPYAQRRPAAQGQAAVGLSRLPPADQRKSPAHPEAVLQVGFFRWHL